MTTAKRNYRLADAGVPLHVHVSLVNETGRAAMLAGTAMKLYRFDER